MASIYLYLYWKTVDSSEEVAVSAIHDLHHFWLETCLPILEKIDQRVRAQYEGFHLWIPDISSLLFECEVDETNDGDPIYQYQLTTEIHIENGFYDDHGNPEKIDEYTNWHGETDGMERVEPLFQYGEWNELNPYVEIDDLECPVLRVCFNSIIAPVGDSPNKRP